MSVEVHRPEQNGSLEEVEDGDFDNMWNNKTVRKSAPLKEGRVIKKAKRPSKQSPNSDEEAVNGTAVSSNGNRLPFTKNSKKSRNLKGRGLPKKGGAGGKGVWGAPGSELFASEQCDDIHDPNYDSDSQENYKLQQVEPELPEGEVHKAVEPVIQEFFEHGDAEEAIDTLGELNFGRHIHKVPGVAISIALDRHDPQREMTSRLISDMYGRILTQEEMAKGFDDVLNNLSDLTLDTPEAPTMLGQFIARAVADDCLPPKYLHSYKGKLDCPHTQVALDKADVLLSMNHGIVRLDNVWGVGGGNRPVKYLIKRMALLLKEYLSSSDIKEAVHCLRELDVPHFHHEFVYEAVVMVIEDSHDRAADQIVELLKYMTTTNIVTPDQMVKGMRRVFNNMGDISLDVPAAYSLLERLGNKMYAEGILPELLFKDLPVRGRKRFVSEGDGGRVKENSALLL